MAYATRTSVEGVIGRSLTDAEVAGLPALFSAIDLYINEQCGREFTTADAASTRYYDVEQSRILDVDAFIVDEDHDLVVAYVDADENVLQTIDASDYEARPRNEAAKTYLHRRSGTWGTGCPARVANLAVTAHFGAGDAPADIIYAASWLAAQAIGSTNSLQLKSESIEGYSRTFADATKSNSIIQATFDKFTEVLL